MKGLLSILVMLAVGQAQSAVSPTSTLTNTLTLQEDLKAPLLTFAQGKLSGRIVRGSKIGTWTITNPNGLPANASLALGGASSGDSSYGYAIMGEVKRQIRTTYKDEHRSANTAVDTGQIPAGGTDTVGIVAFGEPDNIWEPGEYKVTALAWLWN